jgi:hypothetical protein
LRKKARFVCIGSYSDVGACGKHHAFVLSSFPLQWSLRVSGARLHPWQTTASFFKSSKRALVFWLSSACNVMHLGKNETDNMPAVVAARENDMGVFIISPTDKGGRLYDPTPKVK